MAGDGRYWQQQLFYCSHWTPEIESTFVESLLEHHRKGTFHHDRVNCHAVLCACFDINAKYGATFPYSYCQRRLTKLKIRYSVFHWITRLAAVEWDPKQMQISTDDYVWEQITKAKKIGKAYVRAVEQHWNALLMLFGDCKEADNIDDEQDFFDPSGTCPDDGWVHEIPPSVEESSEYESDGYMDADSELDPSWWAFIQEYYAFDTDTASVNMNMCNNRRRHTSEPQSPIQPSSHNSNATPSSCASNEPEHVAKSPSPLLDRYLLRRPPKKQKF